MQTPKRLAAHSSSAALPPVRASSRSCSSTVALFFELSSARPQLMRPPGSQRHRHPRPRRPTLPSPDSTPQQTLLSLPRRPQFVVEPIGKQYAHPVPVRSPARSPPAPTSPLPESSSFSSSLFLVRRGQKTISPHATQPALNGQQSKPSSLSSLMKMLNSPSS